MSDTLMTQSLMSTGMTSTQLAPQPRKPFDPVRAVRLIGVSALMSVLAACSTTSTAPQSERSTAYHAQGKSHAGGRYSMDKDSGEGLPALDPDSIPDAVPVDEPRTAAGNKTPYTVLGETYNVMPESTGYVQTGKASWYGKKFHGYSTSNGEMYSMYKMSGAHKTLPIPSYVRVTNLDNGKQTIVRINDRGPFHSERIIDLSYAAAVKLDVVRTGTANVKLEAIQPSSNAYAAREAEQDALMVMANHSESRKPVARKPAAARPAATELDSLPDEPVVRDITANNKPAANKAASSKSVVAAASGSATQEVKVADSKPATLPASGTTYLQAGAFRNQDSAHALRNKIAALTGKPVSVNDAKGLYKVQIGPLKDKRALDQVAELLVANNFGKPQVIYF